MFADGTAARARPLAPDRLEVTLADGRVRILRLGLGEDAPEVAVRDPTVTVPAAPGPGRWPDGLGPEDLVLVTSAFL